MRAGQCEDRIKQIYVINPVIGSVNGLCLCRKGQYEAPAGFGLESEQPNKLIC